MSGGVRLRRTPVALARRFFQIVADAASEAIAEEGVKPQHLAALVSLSKETGDPGIDQNGLAARLGLERARVSQLVDEMERLGLIDRRVNGADRRARLLRLTPQGEALRARVHPKGLAAQARVLAGLPSADREHLFDLLIRVIQLNAAPSSPTPVRGKRGERNSTAGKSQLSPPTRI
jgi:DNA-binding MarR family transcriptional regulator